MKFLVDENLPPRLAAWLRAKGHDATHVRSLALVSLSDQAVAIAAAEGGYAIVTKDIDFESPNFGVAVVRLSIGNCSTDELFAWLDQHLGKAVVQLDAGACRVVL